ncbi:MAG: radical SAM protein [Candidatus Nanoarchaeia archaeon]|nr:radical SAM protein [Candidatus Nanoarchaeia archaeon]
MIHNIKTNETIRIYPELYDFIRKAQHRNIQKIDELASGANISKALQFLFKEKGLCLSEQEYAFPELKEGVYLKEAMIEITGHCNLACRHCYMVDYQKYELSKEEMYDIIDQLHKMGATGMALSGGEPLTHPYFDDIVNYAILKGIRVGEIYTNGTLISKKFDILKKIADNFGRIEVYVSLDGIGKTHDSFRGQPGAFEKTIEGIKLLKKLGVQINITSTLSRHNIGEIFEFYEFVKTLGIYNWHVSQPFGIGRWTTIEEDMRISPGEECGIYIEIIKRYLRDKPEMHINFSEFFNSIILEKGLRFFSCDSHVCPYARNRCGIKPNKDITWCTSLNEQIVGNLGNNSLSGIWNSESMRKMKDLKVENLKSCKNCRYMHICGGGCRVYSQLYNKDVLSEDPRKCFFVREFYAKVVPMLPKDLKASILNKVE